MICHPQRLPDAAARQLWVENRVPARPIARAASTIRSFWNAGLRFGELRRELRVELLQRDDERIECLGQVRSFGAQVRSPVHPLAHELAVEQLLFEEDPRECQEQRPFRARVRG